MAFFGDDDSDYATEAPLPTPGGTPYRTPSNISREHSRSSSPTRSTKRLSKIQNSQHRISMQPAEQYDEFDPRRFTPTLHANLVAEILSLRRDLESKSSFVDQLESELAASRREKEDAENSVSNALKEARDVKRQLARAESDDVALEVMRERDEAVEGLEELKKQLDRVTKSRRAAEEDLQQIKRIQERDSERFEEMKRALERRAHVAEGRLKAVLDEIATQEQTPMSPTAHSLREYGTENEEGQESDAFSPTSPKRASTALSFNRGRPTSLLMGDSEAYTLGLSLHTERSPGGLSLAEELEGEESDEELEDEEEELEMLHEITQEGSFQTAEDHDEYQDGDGDGDPAEPQPDAESRDGSTPGEMITDVESLPEEDELPDLYASDIAVQVVPEFDPSERIGEIEALIEEKAAELERTYNALNDKTTELDSAYGELDQAHSRIFDLEEHVKTLAASSRRIAELEEQIKAHAAAGLRIAELEEQVRTLDSSSSANEERFNKANFTIAKLEERLGDLSASSREKDGEFGQAASKIADLEDQIRNLTSLSRETEEDFDQANITITELEEQLRALRRKEEQFTKEQAQHAKHIKVFEARAREVEVRWMKVSTRDSELGVRETKLDEQASYLDRKSKDLAEREKYLEEREHAMKALANRPSAGSPDDKDSLVNKVEYEANVRKKRAAGVITSVNRPLSPTYVSVEAQTLMPATPPATPLLPVEQPRAEMHTASTQTDPQKHIPPRIINVPTIMISSPPTTPSLPVSRPVMKDMAVQTKSTSHMKTTSMQTEEINVAERLKKIAPHLLPSALGPSPVSTEQQFSPPTRRRSTRRTSKRISAPIVVPKSPPRSVPAPRSAVQFTSPRAGEEADNEVVSSRAKGKKPLPLHVVDTAAAHSSGDDDFDDPSFEDPEFHTQLSPPSQPKKKRDSLALKAGAFDDAFRPGASKSSNIRKSALVSSGVRAHAQTASISSSTQTNDTKGPPIPVPPRRSSKTPGYTSDMTDSPTPQSEKFTRTSTGGTAIIHRQPSVRKVRSAAALSRARDSPRRGSPPPPLDMSLVVPGSPDHGAPPMPKNYITSAKSERSAFGVRHSRQDSISTSPTGGDDESMEGPAQQISVVDAISQTMIGEWMWKYVRRRRSFAAKSPGMSPGGPTDDTTGGERHRRWVWLAPYERMVMWSSRQPTSGPALLGKSGRKRKRSLLHPFGGASSSTSSKLVSSVLTTKQVIIQSVLDVKDDGPPPKGASQPVFNRSILILTPARALKFTAPNRDRHYVWLTALSFLAHSGPETSGTLALPPPLPFEYEQIERQQPAHHTPPPPDSTPPKPGSFSRTRDSVRLAKGKSRNLQVNSYALPPRTDSIREHSLDGGALPPSVPRFAGTTTIPDNLGDRRKRKGREPPPLLRSSGQILSAFAGGATSPSVNSGSGRSSQASSRMTGSTRDPGPPGTIRMDAFVRRDTTPSERSSSMRYELGEDELLIAPRVGRSASRLSDYGGGGGREKKGYADIYTGAERLGWGGPGPAVKRESSISAMSRESEPVVEDEAYWKLDDPFRGF